MARDRREGDLAFHARQRKAEADVHAEAERQVRRAAAREVQPVGLLVGFRIARMEGQVALPAVARHWKEIALAAPEAKLEWLNSMVFRGMTSLPLRVAL